MEDNIARPKDGDEDDWWTFVGDESQTRIDKSISAVFEGFLLLYLHHHRLHHSPLLSNPKLFELQVISID
ncbi:hypothetical protein L1887_18297 [Cichorium endivia]|nr:hypothetical protein L1887_18297 [Cichorium endivia]